MYCLITPARNEGKHLPAIVERIRDQTRRPIRWLIVDDGSSDATPALVETYSERHAWISGIHLDRGDAAYDTEFGYATVVAAGLEVIREEYAADWTRSRYVGILDADILVHPEYFATLLDEMHTREHCGVASGLLHLDGKRDTPAGTPWGGAMLIDTRCLAEVGGYPITPSPDTVLRIKAEKRGWESLKTGAARGAQLRPPQSARGVWHGYKRKGTGRYYLHYHPVNALLTGVYHTLSPPFYAGIAYLYGYLGPYLRGEARLDDQELEEYYRRERYDHLKQSLRHRMAVVWNHATNTVRRG
ncbi:glycosyltransferase family 2 protein [Natrialbaceae archaeon GCM10025810]|uniref:glycosyltransferase family 2 protein n=1 Tax=Halovalidus salilacus TaxID=3075124 RepID=UPI00361ADD29